MTTQKHYTLVDGPSKFDLMLSLFTGKEVTFRLDSVNQFTVTINSLEIEDGSRENWLLKGYVRERLSWQSKESSIRFSGFFGCHRRRGWIEFH